MALRIVDEVTDWIGPEAWLGYDMARSVAINARHELPRADKISRNSLTPPTARRTQKENASDEISPCKETPMLCKLMHLTSG